MEFNCFKCNGLEKACEKLRLAESPVVCSWYLVAQEDILKAERGIPYITLNVMYQQYLKEKVSPKPSS